MKIKPPRPPSALIKMFTLCHFSDSILHDYYCTQVAELAAEKSDIFIQYLQDNVPPGVSVHMELVRYLPVAAVGYSQFTLGLDAINIHLVSTVADESCK